jgi:hypothetical protein
MTTKAGLAKLDCATCGEQTLHRALSCIHCGSTNNHSAAPPLPKSAARHFNNQTEARTQARLEGVAARNRARAARTSLTTRSSG